MDRVLSTAGSESKTAMRVLVTCSAGHLGVALMRLLPIWGHLAIGLDLKPSLGTAHVGSITDRALVMRALQQVDAVIHTASLHKQHIVTHCEQKFIDTNITGTYTLLEAAETRGVTRFVMSSTTSAFGAALMPSVVAPAAWIDETVTPVVKNIYGFSKVAAEDLCQLFARQTSINTVVLRLTRFFAEPDDSELVRRCFADTNAKANEFLYRWIDLKDAVLALINALFACEKRGFGRAVISATTPFQRQYLVALRIDPSAVVAALFPDFTAIYGAAGYRMFSDIDRVYVSHRARQALDWVPQNDFGRVSTQIRDGGPIGSALAREVGARGGHD